MRSSLYNPAGTNHLNQLRNYQQFIRTAGPTQAMWQFQNQAWAANNYGMGRAAAGRGAPRPNAGGGAVGGGAGGTGGGGGGGAAPAAGGGGGNWGNPMAGWRQPGWGTNKANFTAGTGSGGNFGKSAIQGMTSSAKARSVVNLVSNLGTGRMPLIFRTTLAAYTVSKLSQLGGAAFDAGMKDVQATDTASMVSAHFGQNVKQAVANQVAEVGKSIITGFSGFMKGSAVLAGLVGATTGTLLGASDEKVASGFGALMKYTKSATDVLASKYLGGTDTEIRQRTTSNQFQALFAAGEVAKEAAKKYATEFADRNADELAALGFGTGAQIRGMVLNSAAYRTLSSNAVWTAHGLGVTVKEPSNGED